MKKRLIIIGAGGHGKVCADVAIKMNRWKEILFLDDNPELNVSMGIPVVGDTTSFQQYIYDSDIFVAIGCNKIRKHVLENVLNAGASIPVLIHPSAILGHDVQIGTGSVLMANVVINPCSSIGVGCIINTGATIDHDCRLGDFVHISPGSSIAGSVTIGDKAWLGIGAVVSNNLTISAECTIGAGAVVVYSINDKGTYVGVPAQMKNR